MAATYRVEVTRLAVADLEEIWDYIAQDNRAAATAFVLSLEQQLLSLECFPERCPRIAENELLGTDYRHLITGKYRTIFRISGSTVMVLRIIHGSRLLDTSLFTPEGA